MTKKRMILMKKIKQWLQTYDTNLGYLIAKQALTFLVVLLPLQIAGIIILPFVLPFVSKDKEQLPRFVRWFDNHESYYAFMHSQIDGLAGSAKYRRQQGLTEDSSALKLFYIRYKWLALRNALNYFQYKYLGLNWVVDGYEYKVVTTRGDSEVNEDFPGSYTVILREPGTNKVFFEHYKCIKIPYFPVVLRIRIGHKIGHPSENPAGETSQWVFIPVSILGSDYKEDK